MATFKVGEIILGQNFIHETFRNNMEGEVISPLIYGEARQSADGAISKDWRHHIRWSDGSVTVQQPKYLKKKPPPPDVVEWANQKVKDLLKTVPVEVTL
jgi:hypothetical protein